jgi:hypothetical protein
MLLFSKSLLLKTHKYMKIRPFTQISIIILFVLFQKVSLAQVGINDTGVAPDPNAVMDISSTTKGLLIPRMTTAQRTALATSVGLTVYDTDTQGFWFYNGTTWVNSSTQWNTNASGINYLNGDVGIGITNPSTYGHGGINRFLNIYNPNTVPNAQSHVILSSSSLLGSLGGLTWASSSITASDRRTGYIGSSFESTSSASAPRASMIFFTSNGGTFSERFRINSFGNIGIGTTAPNAPLQFANTTVNRKIVLYEGNNNDHQFYGFGVNSNGTNGSIRYQTFSISDDHVFYAGTSPTTSNRIMTLKGSGNVGIGTAELTTLYTPLTVQSNTGGAALFLSSVTGTNTTDGFYVGLGSNNESYLLNNENTSLNLGTNGINRLIISNTGEIIVTNKIYTEAFQSVTFQNTWHNLSASLGYSTAQFYKDKTGRVYLKGNMSCALGGTAAGTVVFNLPSGYRPMNNESLVFTVNAQTSTGTGLLVIRGNGDVELFTPTSFLAIDGISFRAE